MRVKLSSLLAGSALAAISFVAMTSSAQARFEIYLDTGDYWRHHHYDYCYYHDCGDRWYLRHHRHRWRDRDWWRDRRDDGDWRGDGWRDGGADGDWGDEDDHHYEHHDDDDDDGY